jgi:hypothetical protein
VEALLEADPKEFSFGTFYVFSLSLFSLCGSTVLLETDPNEFDFGNFPCYSYFFFSLCKIPTGESQSALKNTKQIFLSLSSFCGFSP